MASHLSIDFLVNGMIFVALADDPKNAVCGFLQSMVTTGNPARTVLTIALPMTIPWRTLARGLPHTRLPLLPLSVGTMVLPFIFPTSGGDAFEWDEPSQLIDWQVRGTRASAYSLSITIVGQPDFEP